MNNFIESLFSILKTTFIETYKIALKVFKVLIPTTIFIKILSELGWVEYLAYPLTPLMKIVGLPAEYGLVWASAILVNLYSGMAVMLAIIPQIGMPTIAQASTISLMMLIAHSLLVECKIAQECGVSFWSQFIIRFIAAMFAGILMHLFYSLTGIHSGMANILLEVPQKDNSIAIWLMGEAKNLIRVFCIIWLVLLIHHILTRIKATDILENKLSPFLASLGMSKAAASVMVVGFCAGIIYGSGLIIKASQEGKMSKKDLFCAISLMGLAHALIEDTILMLLVGSSAWVALGIRFIVTIIFGLLINYFYDKFATKKV